LKAEKEEMKVLICGDIPDSNSWKLLLERLSDLQKSSNGPFDLLLLTGVITVNEQAELQQIESQLIALKIAVTGFQALVNQSTTLSFDYIQLVPDNVGLWNSKENLSIGYFLLSDPSPEDTTKMDKIIDSAGYRGCDFLVSRFWPMKSEQLLPNEALTQLYSHPSLKKNPQTSNPTLPMFINRIRPRYIFLSGLDGFYQRVPFLIESSTSSFSSSSTKIFSRLITLDQVSTSKEKHNKYLHALSLNPLIFMSKEELEIPPADATLNPYHGHHLSSENNSADQQPPLKRLKTTPSELTSHFVSASAANNRNGSKPPPPPPLPSQASSFFFKDSSQNQGSSSSSSSYHKAPHRQQVDSSSSENSKTLYVGNLGTQIQESQLEQIFPTAVKIRKIANKNYAFVEFENHKEAENHFNFAEKDDNSGGGGGTMKVFGRNVIVRWAAGEQQQQSNTTRGGETGGGNAFNNEPDENLLIPPNDSCKSLYIGGIPSLQTIQGITQNHLMTLSDYEHHINSALQGLFSASMGFQQIIFKPSPTSATYSPQHSFVEYDSQEAAKTLLEDYFHNQLKINPANLTKKYQIDGVNLWIKWPKTSPSHQNTGGSNWNSWNLLNEQPNDCKVIFIGHLPTSETDDVENNTDKSIPEESRIHQLKDLLFKEYHFPKEQLEKEVLSIHQPEGRGYAFLDCLNISAAAKVMKTLISCYQELKKKEKPSDSTTEPQEAPHYLKFGWAKGKNADKKTQSEDCWFCLASPTVKVRNTAIVIDYH
jgi:RNA recognition motif-containing protein